MVSYNIIFDIMRWGLRPCMEMETNANEMIVNYGDVGFGLIMDTRLAPLMRLRVWGSPSLGLAPRMTWSFFLAR